MKLGIRSAGEGAISFIFGVGCGNLCGLLIADVGKK